MKRRNYIKSVASLPVLSSFSLPSLSDSESEDDEFPYVIEAMWHRGNESGRIYTDDFRYQYEEYDQWEASAVVFSSLYGMDIVPKLSRIEDTHLISLRDAKKGICGVLLTAESQDVDISVSTIKRYTVTVHDYNNRNYNIKCENLADVKQSIERRI